MSKYQDIYPSSPQSSSQSINRTSVSDIFTLEYFEAEPAEMPIQKFDQHHILINLKEVPVRVENWRDGEHRDFIFNKNEIVVTPSGVASGWKWHEKSKVIVITLEPKNFEDFALKELGLVLSSEQLKNTPQFKDKDITNAAKFIYEAMESKDLGYLVLYESLSRVFLVKLIQKYGEKKIENYSDKKGFGADKYKAVLSYVKNNFSQSISIEDMASVVAMSPYHFSRLFKESVGKTPMQFVQEHRIDEAKVLLKDLNLPIIDIANRCGFSDQSHFSKVFKKVSGMSPKSFRKSI